MAFTQQQKNQLTLLSSNPEEFLKLIDNNSIRESYKNQFYQEGDGIYHLIFLNLKNNPDQSKIYEKIFDKFLNESSIDVFQSKGRQKNAVQDSIGYFSNNNEIYCSLLKKILKFLKSDIKDWSYKYKAESIIKYLFEHSYFESTLNIIQNKNILTDDILKIILNTIIKNNSVKQFDYFIKNFPNELKKIEDIVFSIYNKDETIVYNIIGLSEKFNSFDILFHLIKQFPNISKNNDFKYSNSYNNKITKYNPLMNIAKKALLDDNFSYFELCIKNCSDLDKLNLLTNFYNEGYYTKYVLAELLNSNYAKKTEDYIHEILSSKTIESEKKLSFLTKLFSYINYHGNKDIQFEYVNKILQDNKTYIPKYNPNEKYGSTLLEHSFFQKMLKNPILNTNQIKAYIEIVQLLLDKNHIESNNNNAYDITAFLNPNIMKFILNNIPFKKTIKIDTIFKQQTESLSKNDTLSNKQDEELYNKLLQNKINTLSVIKSIKLDYFLNDNIYLEKMKELDTDFISLYSNYDLKNMIDNNLLDLSITHNFSKLTNNIELDNPNLIFDQFVEKSIDYNYSFYNKKTDFYSLFNNVVDNQLILKIIEKEKIPLHDIFNDIDFWKSIKTMEKKDLIIDLISKNNIKITESLPFDILFINSLSLNILLHILPSTLTQDGNTLLHIAVKSSFGNGLNIAQQLIDIDPKLCTIVNKQNKLPISYLFSDLDKEPIKDNSANSWNRKETPVKNTFEKMLTQGGLTKNIKTLKIIEEQFIKYPGILNKYPDFKTIYDFKKMEAFVPKNNESKVKKLKL